MPAWKPLVKNIKSTDAVSDKVVNVPINQLAERTDYLKAILDNIISNEFNYLSNMPVVATAEIGEAVYWDSANRRFGRVLAGWDDNMSAYGSLLPAESSYMTGILVSKHTGNTGAIVISGYLSDFQNLEELFGEVAPAAGIYYVSGDNQGKLTAEAPPMTIPAVMYDGAGNILMLPTGSIVSQHDHHKYTLEDSLWITADVGNFPDMTIPAGAIWGYDLENADPDLQSLFNLYTGTGSFVLYESGTVLNEDYIEFTTENIWIKDADVPPEDIIAHIAFPNSHGPNIVRSATTDTPAYLSFAIENGLLTITAVEPTADETEDDSYIAVKDIVDNVMKKGPVVTQLVAGAGLVLTSEDNDGHGVCSLALISEYDRIVDADIINLNNAIQRTDGGLVYSVFPGGRDSSMTLVANAGQWYGDDRQLKIRLWIRGTTDNAVTPEFDLEIFVFPPANAAGVDIPTVYNAVLPEGLVATDPDKYYLCELDIEDNITIVPGSQIQYNIEPVSQPTEDYLVLRQGITTYTP